MYIRCTNDVQKVQGLGQGQGEGNVYYDCQSFVEGRGH